MASKQTILDNVAMYSADELVQYVRSGVVTMDELTTLTDGNLSDATRDEMTRILAGAAAPAPSPVVPPSAPSEHTIVMSTPHPVTPPAAPIHSNSEVSLKHKRSFDLQKDSDSSSPESFQAWNAVDKNSIPALRQFCDEYPADSHVIEARKRINALRAEEFMGYDTQSLATRIKAIHSDKNVINKDQETYNTITDYLDRNKITLRDLVQMIAEDHNVLRASVIKMLLDNGYMDYDDLAATGIRPEFVRNLVSGESSQAFAIPRKLDRINKMSTEVYFWGIPSSGKSCALGAILSVAGNGHIARSMSQDNDCQGYGYMTRLASLFRSTSRVGTLPEGTPVFSTYEMGFDLEDQEGYTHPITCIDLAGELVRCMYKSDAGEEMSDDELEALDTLTNVLIDNRSVNRKVHFFVIEYGAEDRMYEGLTQSVYLDGALRYIERSGIFKNDTDAIYLMISKVDKANAQPGQLGDVLREYIQRNYAGFYNGLTKICRDHEINRGVVEVLPFTLGEVCLQDYCIFDEHTAGNVVRKILARSKGFKNTKTSRFLGLFKK